MYVRNTYDMVQGTRNSKHRFKVPLKKTNMGQNSLSYLGPKLWNNLPSPSSKSRNIFKHKIKSGIFERNTKEYKGVQKSTKEYKGVQVVERSTTEYKGVQRST